MLRIYVLGEFQLRHPGADQAEVLQLPTQKARALLAFLVLHRARAHPRTVLAGQFWGDLPEARARHNLADALWRIRQVIGPGYLVAHQHTLRFNPDADYWLDVAEFGRLVNQETGKLGDREIGKLVDWSSDYNPNLPIYQPTNLPTYQSTNLPTYQSTNLSNLRQAVELYRGDLLEGFYDDWCLLEREHWRATYLNALRALLAQHKMRGEYEAALRYGQRLVVSDPLREQAHREVMQLLALLGRRNAALRQYLICRRTLAAELGIEPLPETTALYRQLRQAVAAQAAAPPPADLGQVALVGRDAERTHALARLEAAIQGRGGYLLIEGEAGVGKTRLAHELAAGARWRDVAVALGHTQGPAEGAELVGSPAYGLLVAALRQALSPLRIMQLRRLLDPARLQDAAVLLPELVEQPGRLAPHAGLSGEQAQARLVAAVAQVLAGLGRIAPHLLILEDLHWADPATLRALPALVAHLDAARVLILLTARPEDSAGRPLVLETLQALDRVGALDRLALDRLNAEHVAEFVARALAWRAAPPGLAARLYHETAGNPLFMVETLADWRESGALTPEAPAGWVWRDQQAPDHGGSVPAGIRTLVQRRLDRLSPLARHTAEVAAVIGVEVDFEVLDAICALATPTFLDTASELVRQRVLVEQDAGYQFGHDQVRQVIYALLPAARRRQLHAQVAQALQSRAPEPIELLAHHFWHAQDWDQAAAYALAAGELARQVYAVETARSHYDRVIELGDRAGERFAQALRRRCEIWELVGRYDRALQDSAALYEWGQKRDDACTMSLALDRSGWYHCLRGELDQGLSDAQHAYAQAHRAGDPQLQSEALSTAGALHGTRGNLDEALDLFQQAVALVQEQDDPARIARLWHNIGATHLLRGDNTAALGAFAEALTRRRALDDRRGMAWTLTNTGHIHYNQGRLDAAQAAFGEAQAIWQELHIRPDSLLTRIGLGAVQKSRGCLAAALDTFDEALVIARECRDRQNEIMIQQNRGDILVAQGRYTPAQAAFESALAHARESGFAHQAAYTLTRLGHLRLALDAAPAARTCFEEAEAILQGKGARHDEADVQRGLGLAWLALGDPAQARRRLEQASDWAGGVGAAQIGIANSLTALDLAVGAPDEAQARAAATAAQAAALGYCKLAAEAGQQQGQVLLALGRATEAVAALQHALDIAEEVGLPAVQWQTLGALARAYRAQGQWPAARDALARAIAIIEELAGHVADEALRASLLASAAVRALYDAQAALGQPAYARLARPDAPTGRPLNPDELVPVAWTVDAGEADAALLAAQGKVALRRARIQRLLAEASAQGGVPTERDLAQALGVTTRTIRSDLAALRRAGHDVRTRGT